MRRTALAAALGVSLVTPAAVLAKTFALGSDPAVATITLPDAWQGDLADGQLEALSPDKAIYLSAETIAAADLQGAGREVARVLAEQKIELKQDSRKVAPLTIAGMAGAAITWEARDADGPTQVHIIALKARPDTELLVLRWGDAAAETDHAAEIESIVKSLAPAK